MDKRKRELSELTDYIDQIDKETTLLLQNLQWDSKHFTESPTMVSCKYKPIEHRVPLASVETHERQCYLAELGYTKNDVLLPDVVDPEAQTVVKLDKQQIQEIINAAAASNPLFKRGSGRAEPLSVERLQIAYSADERSAIHSAVVAAAPACHDLTDLALPSTSNGSGERAKSRAEILAELRDMKRRRARYRGAAPSARYSHVLRDLIRTQMELYAEAKGIFIKTEYGPKTFISLHDKGTLTGNGNSGSVVIKRERITPDTQKDVDQSRDIKAERVQNEREGPRQKRTHSDIDKGKSSRSRRERSRSRERQSRDYRENAATSKHRDDRERSKYTDRYSTHRRRDDHSPTKQDKYHHHHQYKYNNRDREDESRHGSSDFRHRERSREYSQNSRHGSNPKEYHKTRHQRESSSSKHYDDKRRREECADYKHSSIKREYE